jgi:hypothetical protein
VKMAAWSKLDNWPVPYCIYVTWHWADILADSRQLLLCHTPSFPSQLCTVLLLRKQLASLAC